MIAALATSLALILAVQHGQRGQLVWMWLCLILALAAWAMTLLTWDEVGEGDLP